MASIYELTTEIQLLWNLMDEGTLDEDMIVDAMMNSQEELSIKLNGYCKWIKSMESDVKGLKEEEARIKAKRQTLENTITRAKKAMQMAMETAGEKKMACGSFTVSLQANPAKVVMDTEDLDKIPECFKKETIEIDKTMLKEVLKAGNVELVGIAHLEQDESLRIR